MVKNYTATWILFAVLLFSFNFSYSQFTHTVTFTGHASDFNETEKIKGNADIDYYVSFDEHYMYVGAFSNITYNTKSQFTIYIDTDPQPIIDTGSGSTTGLLADYKTPTLPFNADHRFSNTRVGGGELFHHKHNGTAWVSQSYDPLSGFVHYAGSNALEIAIPKSIIDNPNGIYFSMFMSRPGPSPIGSLYGVSDIGYPIKFIGDNSTGYFGGIGLNTQIDNPVQYVNTPILNTLTNADPIAGGKYAHIDINDGYYSVTGDIEIVAGGTANIAPGRALTVDGTFTNNGLVTLQSVSTSYSSLIATAVDGSGTAKYHRHVNFNPGNDLISPPLTGQSFLEFATDNPNIYQSTSKPTIKRFGPFNKITGKYINYDTDLSDDANAILTSAMGYRAASNIVAPSTTGGPLTFTGSINTGVVAIDIFDTNNQYAKWNLIGNPYTSYLNMEEFIDLNSNEFDPDFFGVYGYNGESDGWDAINKSNSEGLIMAPGQGFLVMSKIDNGTITFTPNLRVTGDSDDFVPLRSSFAADKSNFELKLSSATKHGSTLIYFNNNGTLDHDTGYETGLIGSAAFSIYSKLVEDVNNRNIELAVQTLPYSILESEVIVPIGIKETQGEQLTVSMVGSLTRPLPTNVDVYFEDNVANTSTLLNNGNYVFTPNATLSGIGRFSLRFTNRTLSVSNPNFDGLEVYSPLNTGNLIVKGYVYENTNLEIFDLNGRLLQTVSVKPNQSVNRFELSTLSTGIYIVKLKNKTQSKVKKIQVNR